VNVVPRFSVWWQMETLYGHESKNRRRNKMYTGKVIDELISCVEKVQQTENLPPKKAPASAGSTFMFLRNFRGEYNTVRVG